MPANCSWLRPMVTQFEHWPALGVMGLKTFQLNLLGNNPHDNRCGRVLACALACLCTRANSTACCMGMAHHAVLTAVLPAVFAGAAAGSSCPCSVAHAC